MADDQLTLFNYYRRYRWTAEDFELLQNQLVDGARVAWEGMTSAAVFDGYIISVNETNLNLIASSGVCIGSSGLCGVKNISTSIDVTAASGSTSGEVKKSLIVVRPTVTEDFAIVSPTDPLSTVNLHKVFGCEVVEIEGEQSLTPDWPQTQPNDVVLCGVRLIPGQTALSKNDIDFSVRDVIGKNSIMHQMLGRFDDRLRPYSISKSVLGIKPSQTEAPFPKMFSYIKETPSIFPKNSSGNYSGLDTYLDFETGAITGGDDFSADFIPTIPDAGNYIVACVGLTQDDILSVSYGLQGSYTECLEGIKNQSTGIAGGVNIISGVKPIAFVVLGSVNGTTLSEMVIVDARSTGGGGGSGAGGNLVKDVFSGDGVETDFSLSIAPGAENNTQVYFSGVYQSKDNYTLNSQVISFSTPPPAGTNNIEVISGEPLPLNVPADDSVTTIKIVDQNVTGAKLANSSVSVAKLASDVTDLLAPGYIANGTAEADTAGWSTYLDAAAALPVDGTGAGANVTWTRSTTDPLRGEAHFVFTKDASNRQGEGVSTDFEIENADLAKVLTISMDYTVLSGSYDSGDLTVYIVEDPTGTPLVVQPAGYIVEKVGVGVQNRLIATFQTSSTNKNYRLCLHVATTNVSAYELAFDSINVLQVKSVYGAPITDWQDYTPTFTALGTPTNVTFRSRRVGSDLEVQGAFTTGTGSSSEARVSLGFNGANSNVTIDTSKMSMNAVVGTAGLSSSSTGYAGSYVLATGANTYLNFSAQLDTVNNLAALNGSAIASGLRLQFSAKVPIVGWSSTVQMSDSTDTRVCSTRISKESGDQAITSTAETTITWERAGVDTHGQFDNANNSIVIALPGIYQLTLRAFLEPCLNEVFTLRIKLNGQTIASTPSSPPTGETGQTITVVSEYNLIAGDVLTATIQSKTDTNYFVDQAVNTSFSVTRVSGPSVIAATETVALSYYSTATTAFGNGPTTIAYATKDYDTHGAWSGTAFTAPVSGKYRITAAIQINGTIGDQQQVDLRIRNTSTSVEYFVAKGNYVGNENTQNRTLSGSVVLDMKAGQAADVRLSTNTTGNQTQMAGSSSARFNYVCIERTGN